MGTASDLPKVAVVKAKTWSSSLFYLLFWLRDGPKEDYKSVNIILEAGVITDALGHQCRAALLEEHQFCEPPMRCIIKYSETIHKQKEFNLFWWVFLIFCYSKLSCLLFSTIFSLMLSFPPAPG